MKTFSKILFEITLIAVISLSIIHFQALAVMAENLLPLSDTSVGVFKDNQIPGPYSAEDLNGMDIAKELVLDYILPYAKIIIAVIGILFITIMGFQLVISGEDEAAAKKATKGILYAIVGFVIISMSQDIAQIFNMEDNTILQNPGEIINRVKIFDNAVEIIINFIKYIIGAVATFVLVVSGIKIMAGGDEETMKKEKKNIGYSVGGLLLLFVARPFINRVFYSTDMGSYAAGDGLNMAVDPGKGVKEIIGITNFIVTFIGPVAILMLIIGAIMYVTAAGDDGRMKRAKTMLVAVGIGILIIYGAFAIVSTVIAGQFPAAATQ